MFDLNHLRKKIESDEILIDDITLSRIIKGNDFLIIVPEVPASKVM